MRVLSLFLAMLLLASCSGFDSEQTKECEQWLLQKVKSPGTYKRVSSDQISHEGYHSASIVFDSENGFGALIRSKAICQFDDQGGKLGALNEAESFLLDGSGPLGELAR